MCVNILTQMVNHVQLTLGGSTLAWLFQQQGCVLPLLAHMQTVPQAFINGGESVCMGGDMLRMSAIMWLSP